MTYSDFHHWQICRDVQVAHDHCAHGRTTVSIRSACGYFVVFTRSFRRDITASRWLRSRTIEWLQQIEAGASGGGQD